MRFSVVVEKSAFCGGGVATTEEPSTVRTPSLQPTGRDLSTQVEARIYGEEIARDDRFTRLRLRSAYDGSRLLQGIQARTEVDMVGVVIEHERWH